MKRPRCLSDQHCACGHNWREHAKGGGACREPSSYGTPCQCPSFEPAEGECLHADCPVHTRQCCGTAPDEPHVGCILR